MTNDITINKVKAYQDKEGNHGLDISYDVRKTFESGQEKVLRHNVKTPIAQTDEITESFDKFKRHAYGICGVVHGETDTILADKMEILSIVFKQKEGVIEKVKITASITTVTGDEAQISTPNIDPEHDTDYEEIEELSADCQTLCDYLTKYLTDRVGLQMNLFPKNKVVQIEKEKKVRATAKG